MKNIQKRLLAFLMAAVMVLTGLPLSAKEAKAAEEVVVTYDLGMPTTGTIPVTFYSAENTAGTAALLDGTDPVVGISRSAVNPAKTPTTAYENYTGSRYVTKALAGTNWSVNTELTTVGTIATCADIYTRPAKTTASGFAYQMWTNGGSNGNIRFFQLGHSSAITLDVVVPEAGDYVVTAVSTGRQNYQGATVSFNGVAVGDIPAGITGVTGTTEVTNTIGTAVGLTEGTNTLTLTHKNMGVGTTNAQAWIRSITLTKIEVDDGSFSVDFREADVTSLLTDGNGRYYYSENTKSRGDAKIAWSVNKEKSHTGMIATLNEDNTFSNAGTRTYVSAGEATYVRLMSGARTIAIDFEVPTAGTYNISTYMPDLSSESEPDKFGYLGFSIDDVYVGTIDCQPINNPTTQNLLSYTFEEAGTHTLAMIAVGSSVEGGDDYANITSVDFYPTDAENARVITSLETIVTPAEYDLAGTIEGLVTFNATTNTEDVILTGDWNYKSSDNSILEVQRTGKVIAKQAGEVEVTTTMGGVQSAPVVVKVNDNRPRYTVTWLDEDGTTVLGTSTNLLAGETPEYEGETPVKEGNAQFSYAFAGWTPEVAAVTGDASYTATYAETLNSYTVTWSVNGKETTETYAYGEMPTAPEVGDIEVDGVAYIFKGWDKEIEAVTGAATYTAVFEEEVQNYTITFVDENGDILYETTVEAGVTPEYAGETPTKAATAQYSYTFTGWTPEIVPATVGTTYTAVFEETVNEYDITWVVDGVSTTERVAYGVVPEFNGTPEKAADAQYTYTFAGWDVEPVAVTGEATYTAKFDTTVNEYEITFVVNGVETKTTYAYGATPVAPATDSYEDAYNVYTFANWDKEIAEVTGEATYRAVYEATAKVYTGAISTRTDSYGELSVEGDVVTLDVNGYVPYAKNPMGVWANWIGFNITAPEGVDAANVVITRPDGTTVALDAIKDATEPVMAILYQGAVPTTSNLVRTYKIDWNGDGVDELSFVMDLTNATLQNPNAGAIGTNVDSHGTLSTDGNVVTLTVEGDVPYAKSATGSWNNWIGFKVTAPEGVDAKNVTILRNDGQTRNLDAIKDGTNPVYAQLYVSAESIEANGNEYKVDWESDGKYDLTIVIDDTDANYLTKTFNVTWVVAGEETVEEYVAGTELTIPEVADYEDAEYTYAFTGWDKDIVTTVEADATYTAVYEATAIPYEARVNGVGCMTFAEAMAVANPGDTVALCTDVTIATTLVLDKDIILDGAGHTLTYTGKDRAITADNASGDVNVTISNLTVDCVASYCQRGINYNDSASLTLNEVTVKGTNVTYALNLPSSSDNAVIEINDSYLAGNIAINAWGTNLTITANDSELISIDKSSVENYAAINLCNDALGNTADGSVVTINGGKIEALNYNGELSTAVSNATTATVTISETTVVNGIYARPVAKIETGADAFYTCETVEAAIKAAQAGNTVKLLTDVELSEILTIDKAITLDGDGHTITSSATRAINVDGANGVTIKNVTVEATTSAEDIRAINIINGATNVTIEKVTASAEFYAVNTAASAEGAVVTIKDSTLSGRQPVNVASNNTNVSISGTKIALVDEIENVSYAAISVNAENSHVVVAGGEVSIIGDSVAANVIGLDSSVTFDGTAGETEVKEVVAKVGGWVFYSLADAFDYAAENSATVTLVRDIALDTTVVNTGTVTLDLNGKTITGTDNNTKGNFYLINNSKGNLTITDNAGGGKITLTATVERNLTGSSVVVANNLGTVTLKAGTIEHLGGTSMAYGIDNLTNGKNTVATLNIEGGKVESTYFAIRQFANNGTNNLNISGGEVAYAWMQSPNANANVANISVTGGTVAGICLSGNNAELTMEVAAGTTGTVYGTAPNGYIITGSPETGFGLERATYAEAISTNGNSYGELAVDGSVVTLTVEGEVPYTKNPEGVWANWIGFKVTTPEDVDAADVIITRPDGTTTTLAAALDNETEANIYTGAVPTTSLFVREYKIDWNGDAEDDLTVVIDLTNATLLTKTYDITFVVNGEETVVATQAGDVPVAPAVEDYADAQYTYTFTGWDKEIVAAEAEATYTAEFEQTVNSYTVTWVNFDGEVLATENYEYGQTPEYKGEAPTFEGSTFKGWSPEVEEVTGDVTYTAQYDYTGIYWTEEDGEKVAYYYVNGAVKKNAGVVKIDGYLYFVRYSGKVAFGENQTIKEANANGLVEPGTYYCYNNGIIATPDVRLNGELRWTEEDGKMVGYYYVQDELCKDVGLVEIYNEEAGENVWYYVLYSGKVKRNYVEDGKRVSQTVTAEKLNNYTGEAGVYTFFEDGVMYDPLATETGKVVEENGAYYYYVDGHIRKDAGLVRVPNTCEWAGEYVFVTYSGKLKVNAKQTVKESRCNGHTELIGTHYFDELGCMVQ